VAVGHNGQLAVHALGKLTYGAHAARVTPQTIYDAASLTKPVVTATLAAMLEEAGQLQLDAPVTRYAPEWAAGQGAVAEESALAPKPRSGWEALRSEPMGKGRGRPK
jgi:CubicO group peptidase (beta-lactamase class C family)